MVQNVPYFKDKGDSNSSAGWKVSAQLISNKNLIIKCIFLTVAHAEKRYFSLAHTHTTRVGIFEVYSTGFSTYLELYERERRG
jgi:hypothetical protein